MTERRYNEEEIARIFTDAQMSDAPRRPTAAGFTLSELQEIGREVGIAPGAVAHAAAGLDRPPSSLLPAVITRRYFGVPIAVVRTVELPRRLSDAEWEQLVVDLRTTFDARGRLRVQGSFREWHKGYLRATLEPMEHGERFRLQTFQGRVRIMMAGGLITLAGAATMFLLAAAEISTDVDVLQGAAVLSVVGLGIFGSVAMRLKSWAQLRRQQFDAIVERLRSAISSASPPSPK